MSFCFFATKNASTKKMRKEPGEERTILHTKPEKAHSYIAMKPLVTSRAELESRRAAARMGKRVEDRIFQTMGDNGPLFLPPIHFKLIFQPIKCNKNVVLMSICCKNV